ncbi:hypothetical protein [uncultured Tateyamaria sp.]|uniref:hypothetical protein n=1 Tax=uncultured Tateyamaria sp. TaxID=455651 RepID=UPI0026129863|nr:hypothetical protein [uncultured Tateyamaria sp.]
MTDQIPLEVTLARELVALRTELAALKDRETHVRLALLHQISAHVDQHDIPVGDTVVRIERKAVRRFDAKRLPPDIRDNPRFVRCQTMTDVRLLDTSGPSDTTDFDVTNLLDVALRGT